ncbi:hypothetical protein AB8S08_02705 [Pseudidiomarina sp. PP-1MA]|uniref:Uncharacterized protein n=1 Tax=Pseudidiomarina sp. PP-1MA TaxID=3237706 RepID=A0AB39XAQ4_9GAMM
MKNLCNEFNAKVSAEATDKKIWETPEVIDFAVDMTESKTLTAPTEHSIFGPPS